MAILVQSNKKPSVSYPEQTGSIVTFNSQFAGLPLKSCKVNIPVTQEGTGDPSPDNVRPISGYSNIHISQSGGNVWDETWTNGYYDYREGGAFVSDARFVCCLNRIEILPNTTYILDFPNFGYEIELYDESGTYTRRATPRGRQTITTQSEYFMTFYMSTPYGRVYNNDISIEMVNVAKTISIGSTVYGGEYDARTGLLTVTHKLVDLSALTYNTTSWGAYRTQAPSDCIVLSSSGASDSFGSNYIYTTYQVLNANKPNNHIALYSTYIYIVSDSTPTGYLLYELAEPEVINLGGMNIETLQGENNLFASTGETTVQYIKIGG